MTRYQRTSRLPGFEPHNCADPQVYSPKPIRVDAGWEDPPEISSFTQAFVDDRRMKVPDLRVVDMFEVDPPLHNTPTIGAALLCSGKEALNRIGLVIDMYGRLSAEDSTMHYIPEHLDFALEGLFSQIEILISQGIINEAVYGKNMQIHLAGGNFSWNSFATRGYLKSAVARLFDIDNPTKSVWLDKNLKLGHKGCCINVPINGTNSSAPYYFISACVPSLDEWKTKGEAIIAPTTVLPSKFWSTVNNSERRISKKQVKRTNQKLRQGRLF